MAEKNQLIEKIEAGNCMLLGFSKYDMPEKQNLVVIAGEIFSLTRNNPKFPYIGKTAAILLFSRYIEGIVTTIDKLRSKIAHYQKFVDAGEIAKARECYLSCKMHPEAALPQLEERLAHWRELIKEA